MKAIATAVCILFFSSLCSAQQGSGTSSTAATKPSATAPFSWDTRSYDFGKTRAGTPVSFEFRFSNTGLAPIIISSVKVACDCTVTTYTRDPVQHGASGFVRATFDGQAVGVYSKTISVYANTPEGIVSLNIKGEIIE